MDLFEFSDQEPTATEKIIQKKEIPLVVSKHDSPRDMCMISNRIITKADYRKGLYTTHSYYAQYVTNEIIDLVVERLGKEAIIRSTKPNFSDIRQDTIDSLDGPIHLIINQDQIKQAGEEIPYLCFNVCVAIAAATIYKNKASND
jgi:ribosome assembly protein YihI (activator of Der GTPase)